MNIANYRILVWRKNHDHETPQAVGFAGSKRSIMHLFAKAVQQAGQKNWRRVVACEGGYLTGTYLQDWHV